MFQHTELYPSRLLIYPFQNLSLGFILKIFLKFRKFQPQYSYKTYSYKKKKECISMVCRYYFHHGRYGLEFFWGMKFIQTAGVTNIAINNYDA